MPYSLLDVDNPRSYGLFNPSRSVLKMCGKIVLTRINVVSVVQVFEKSITSPVLVSFASETTPIWKIPFPALTVCNMNKVTMIQMVYQLYNIDVIKFVKSSQANSF